jgi:hypothetical protein
LSNQYIIQFGTIAKYCKHRYERPQGPNAMKYKFGCGHAVRKRKKKIELPSEINAHYRCTETNCPILSRLNQEGFF